MKIDRATFKPFVGLVVYSFQPFVGLVVYSKSSDCFLKIRSFVDTAYLGYDTAYRWWGYNFMEVVTVKFRDSNGELYDNYVVFGEPDFPKEKLPKELVVTDFEDGKSYFFNFQNVIGTFMSDPKETPLLYSTPYIEIFDLTYLTTGTPVVSEDNCIIFKDDQQFEDFKSNCICLSSEYNENSIVGDTICHHPNRRIVSYGAGKSYWYCPDCKEDVGNIS